MIQNVDLLRNIGVFDSVTAGANIPFTKFTLMYAENARGKTTLAAIFRSLCSGDPNPINERQRVATGNTPHLVITDSNGSPAVFQNGAWSITLPDIEIFDDVFVADNVCSGIDVDNDHRQSLHELILGAPGVLLHADVQGRVVQIEVHNSNLRVKADAIPAAARGTLTVDEFCALGQQANIDQAILEAEKSVSAAKAADAVRDEPAFETLALPKFDITGTTCLLSRALPDVEAAAMARVQAHLTQLGAGGEDWIGQGMGLIASVSDGSDREICPFCAQELGGSSLISHYQEYFSDAYNELKRAITAGVAAIVAAHSGEVTAAFERAVRVAVQRRQFWDRFTDVPEVDLDTAVIADAWNSAMEAVLEVLNAKSAAPLEHIEVPATTVAAVSAYEDLRTVVAGLNEKLQAANAQIAIVKARAAGANLVMLVADLARLKAIEARYEPSIDALCTDYMQEKVRKATTEQLRDTARAALEAYRHNIFPAYETAINNYLNRFNAGFRVGQVSSVNNRGGSTCTYNVLINNVAVPLMPGQTVGPSFRNTLSAGDRNTLALAFFFARHDQDARAAQKIVVVDDPMTSMDEHRSLTTVQEMQRLVSSVQQVIVLSHSKSFLCALWQGADRNARSAVKIGRAGAASSLAVWDVKLDSITNHDKHHELVRMYVDTGAVGDARSVATALRHMLESFMRVAYPDRFPPEARLGTFLGICDCNKGTPDQILSQPDITELRDILGYANRFHHDTNPAWATVNINENELTHFSVRTLKFTRRP